MNARIITLWAAIRFSYWFVPSLMSLGAIFLSFVTTAIDSNIGSEWLENISWLYANKPSGARAVLSTVAGSMITVAGVTFSMTILSISYTTGQVGPRLLNNFMRDKGNQFTLGVFISTYLYCLLVLRTVRNADSAPSGNAPHPDVISAFVPHTAIIVALLMAVASVGVLIYFIHHVPESIHVSNIVAEVGHELNTRIEEQFPSQMGEPSETQPERNPVAELPESFYQSACKVRNATTGYVQYVDEERLMELATQNDLVIRLRYRSGDFVKEGNILMLADSEGTLSETLSSQLASTFVVGTQRTQTQDLRFVINQLVEVAMRALSPGINDPFTAINSMDWLQSSLANLSERKLPDAHRYDRQQNLRVIAEPETFDSYASLVLINFDRTLLLIVTRRCIQWR